jgi:SAM-dependent methyltransferase
VTNEFTCAVCKSATCKPFLTQCRDLYLRTPNVVDYYQCLSCSLVQQHPIPEDVSSFYRDYPIHVSKPGPYSFIRRVLLSQVYAPPRGWPAGAKLLDFGCGDGWYLRWCKEENLRPVGFEQSESHARVLSSDLDIDILSSLDDLERRYQGAFDVVTMHFVAEHLTDFIGTVRRLSRVVKPGGVIRYVVPNISSWECRMFGRSWHGLDPPRHIAFPTKTHAIYAARESGLELVDETFTSFPNGFGGSVSTAIFGGFNGPAFWLLLPISLVTTFVFRSGNVAFTLRRSAP